MALEKPTKEMRVREVPDEIHRKIKLHQHFMSLQTREDVSLDQACIDLWAKALDAIPAIREVA
jgi:hypothetical protein